MNQLIVKNFLASAAIADKRYVKLGATDGTVLQATGPTDSIIGVVDAPGGAKIGDRVDVVLLGWSAVEAGGTIVRGSLLTSDATGRAVAAAPATGINNRFGGCAFYSAVLGDIVDHLVNPGQIQGA